MVRELVLKENNHKIKVEREYKGKFESTYIGTYIIVAKYPNGSYKLQIVEGKEDKFYANFMHLKSLYV